MNNINTSPIRVPSCFPARSIPQYHIATRPGSLSLSAAACSVEHLVVRLRLCAMHPKKGQ